MFDSHAPGSGSRFDTALRPMSDLLIRRGWQPLHLAGLTIAFAAGLCAALWISGGQAQLFGLYPVVFLIRAGLSTLSEQLTAALSATGSRPPSDLKFAGLVGDTLLILPFLLVPPFTTYWIIIIIGLVWLVELTISRRTDFAASTCPAGPMTACGRAIVFGMLGFLICMIETLSPVFYWFQPIMCISLTVTLMRCLRTGNTRPNAT